MPCPYATTVVVPVVVIPGTKLRHGNKQRKHWPMKPTYEVPPITLVYVLLQLLLLDLSGLKHWCWEWIKRRNINFDRLGVYCKLNEWTTCSCCTCVIFRQCSSCPLLFLVVTVYKSYRRTVQMNIYTLPQAFDSWLGCNFHGRTLDANPTTKRWSVDDCSP